MARTPRTTRLGPPVCDPNNSTCLGRFLCRQGWTRWGAAKNMELGPNGEIPLFCARCYAVGYVKPD